MKNLFTLFLILFSLLSISCTKKKNEEIIFKNGKPLTSKEIQDFFKLVKDSNYDKIKKLISENKAYIFAVDSSTKEFESPLNVAVIRGYNNIAEFFINSNANLDYRDVFGFSALHYCAKMNNTKIAESLLENNANVDILDLSKETPLHISARYNHPEMVKLLLNYNANKEILNESGKTPYDVAKENNSIKVLELLK